MPSQKPHSDGTSETTQNGIGPLGILERGIGNPHRANPKPKPTHPPGMVPRVNLEKGEICAPFQALPPGQERCWKTFLEKMGFAGMVDVLDVVEVRAWNNGQKDEDGNLLTMQYVRAKCRRKPAIENRVDLDALLKHARRRKVKRPPNRRLNDYSLIALLADWQAGKREGGGIKALIKRVYSCLHNLILRIKETDPQEVVLVGLGDLVEGCGEHYAMQTFSVDADRRQQLRAVRRLLLDIIIAVAKVARRVRVVAVGGNHGENRLRGKAFTSFGDNDDVAVFEQVYDACQQNSALKHIQFVLPDHELTATLNCSGIDVAIAHGHQCKRGPKDRRALTWWGDMSHSMQPVGHCTLLFTGHWHHFRCVQDGLKTWFQAPALDGGSKWFQEGGGALTLPGMLTVLVGSCLGQYGWDGIKLI